MKITITGEEQNMPVLLQGGVQNSSYWGGLGVVYAHYLACRSKTPATHIINVCKIQLGLLRELVNF
jgi:hypothetical protein